MLIISLSTCMAAPVCQSKNFFFKGSISRKVLENYLSRSITFYDLLEGSGNFDDHLRLIDNIGAKFIGRALFIWGEELKLEEMLTRAAPSVARVHAHDPEIIMQAGIFEIVSEEVNQLPVPAWLFEEFGLAPETRNFRYEDMLYTDNLVDYHRRDYWRPGASVPDMSRLETRMWFVYLARRYIDAGYEAIHFGQAHIMDDNDPDYLHWQDLLARVRRYAQEKARRGFILCDAHIYTAVANGRLLFDFHSYPLRIEEVTASPWQGVLQMGYLDSIYGKSAGGITPSGWTCEHLPYLVELDNFGASGQEGQNIGGCWIWGYDEISWFAHQDEDYRNYWLAYAWRWVRQHDPNGFVQMPASRCLAAPPGEFAWYYAHTASPATPQGFNQEETIKSIWLLDKSADRITPALNLLLSN
ncbi:MAG: hypothetical protein ACOZF2_18285 [Thermodesulfobacteriota bacterium]